MGKWRMFSLFLAVFCLLSVAVPAEAAEVESIVCFYEEVISGEIPLEGVCITGLSGDGAFLLGERVLREGDVLTKNQAGEVVFIPGSMWAEGAVTVAYLPVYGDAVGAETVQTFSLKHKENQIPVAEDSAVETYKNLPNTGKLKVADPEGEALTYTVTRQPRRGSVEIGEDGSFTYTPKKNKVGIDSFTFTASDPGGKVSREATVTVTILKPTEAAQYRDTMGKNCRFAAEWMKNTGIFVGETVADESCFSPEKEVSRGEFVTMMVKALDIPVEEGVVYTGYTDQVPKWLQPYLAAAVRSGLTAGLQDQEVFGAETAITWAEAAEMVENATDKAVEVLSQGTLTRGEAAVMLYEMMRAEK